MDKIKAKQFLDSVPYINSGGCLVGAYAFQRFCIKIGDDKIPNLVALHRASFDKFYDSNIAAVEQGKIKRASAASHFALTYGGRIFDNTKLIEVNRYQKLIIIPLEISTPFYKNAMRKRQWNPMFDRSYIKTIEQVLEVDMTYLTPRKKKEIINND